VNSGCELLRYVEYCDIGYGKLTKIDTFILQITDRNGERYTNISIPYSKNLKVSDLEGWIEDATGKKVRTLKNNDITERSAISDASLYEDDYVKTFSLKFNTYPYRVSYTYKSVTNQFIEAVNWTPDQFSRVSTREARLIVNVPTDCQVKKYIRNVTCLHQDSTGKMIRYEYLSNYKAIDQDEELSEAYEDIEPRVIFLPQHFFMGISGSNESWKTFGNWVYDLNNGLTDLPDVEKNTINNLIKGISDKREIIKTLYYYLQDHTRYVNVAIGIGGLKSYPASYVSENKYGDCKALTNYMKALLEYAGIKSYFTIIYGDHKPRRLIEEIPFDQFNHMILTIPLENDTIWLDNTSNTEPFGYVSAFIQNRKALFVDEKTSRLINMPVFENKDVTTQRKFLISINESGNAEAKINFSYKGYLYEFFNNLKTSYNQDDLDRKVKDYLPFTNFDVLNWDLHKFDRDTAKIELAATVSIYKLLKSLGSEFYFTVFPIRNITYDLPSERNLALQLPYPVNNVDSIIYSMPFGFEVKSLPDKLNEVSKYGIYECKLIMVGDKLCVTKKFELKAGLYSLEEYKDFFKFINIVKEADKISIVLVNKI